MTSLSNGHKNSKPQRNHKKVVLMEFKTYMYSYYFVKLILISRKLKYFIVTCKSHLSYPSYPSSMNDFLLSSRMSWTYNCLSFSPMTNIQPKTISRVCVWVSESYPSSSSDHEWFPACEWVGEHKCLCFSHRSFSVGVEDPEREGWRSHTNKNKTHFCSATTFSFESVQNVLIGFIIHLHVQIMSWVHNQCFKSINVIFGPHQEYIFRHFVNTKNYMLKEYILESIFQAFCIHLKFGFWSNAHDSLSHQVVATSAVTRN